MTTFSFFRSDTGALTGGSISGPPEFVAANTPTECGTVPGEWDHLCHRVDLETGLVVDWQPPAPADTADATWAWDADAKRWRATPTLAALVLAGHAAIDAAAGAARSRYITEVPGQQAVYLRKAEQARAFLADPAGPVPAYVQAEADAIAGTPLEAAQGIAAVAALWDDQLSPAIERERIAGKRAVSAAADATGVAAAVAAATATLNAI